MIENLIKIICGFAALTAGYTILSKAWSIPMTHDEVATTVHYYNYTFWEIMMYPDPWPNNHILNTIITKVFINLGGKEQWLVRAPNILSFGIYLWGIWRILRAHFSSGDLLIITGFTLFLANSYLLDFFSLCRGYGMATALVTLSSSFLITGYVKDKRRDIWLAILCATLASYANFTALVFWACIIGLSGLYFLKNIYDNKRIALQNIGILAMTSIAYLALIRPPILKMTSTNQFHYWSSKGFYKETIYSLAEHYRYNANWKLGINADTISQFVILAIVAATIITLIKGWRHKNPNSILQQPLTLSLLILLGTAITSILQSLILQTPNLTGRTALFFYPLFYTVLIGLMAQWKSKQVPALRNVFGITLAVILLQHAYATYNFRNVREWWYDENTIHVMDHIQELEKNNSESISMNVHWFFHPSFTFYTATGKAEFMQLHPYDKNINPDSDADYYYVFASDLGQLESKFEKVKQFGWDRWLLRRKLNHTPALNK